MAGPIAISVVADVAKMRAGIDQVNGKLGALGKGAKLLGGAIAAGFVADKVVQFGKEVVRAASDSQQSLGATETVFGKYANTVIATSKKAAQAYGLSANEYRENANLLGALFKNQGVQLDQLGAKTQQFVGVGADLAATYGGTTKEAVEALGSAFKGEFDPLERYGISIKQSAINAELAARGQDKLTGSALKAAQQQATTALIMRQSKDALGAFGRESDTLAGQQQRLSAQFEDVKAKIGTAFLPILTKLVEVVNAVVLPALGTAWTFLSGKLGPVFATVKGYVEQLTGAFGGGGGGGGLSGVIGTVQAVFASFVQTVGPIVSGFVALVRNNWDKIKTWTKQTFGQVKSTISSELELVRAVIDRMLSIYRAVWNRFGDDILRIVKTVFSTIGGVIRGALNIVQGIIRTITALIKGDWSGAWDGIKQIVRGAWQVITSIVKGAGQVLWTVAKAAFGLLKDAASAGISKAVELVRSLPGKVASALGNLGSYLFSKGAALIQGLIDGIMSKISAVGNAIGSVASKVKGFFPGSPVKEGPLTSWNNGGAGKRLVEMLASGLTSSTPRIGRASAGLAAAVNGGLADVSRPAFASSTRTATTDDLVTLLAQLLAAIQGLPRQYRLNERAARA